MAVIYKQIALSFMISHKLSNKQVLHSLSVTSVTDQTPYDEVQLTKWYLVRTDLHLSLFLSN